MAMPPFVADLRRAVGHSPLWLSGSTAVIVREGESGLEVLLVKRSDDGAWSSVCGIVDPGEEPGDAAVREALEEAGVVVEVERLVWMSVTDLVTYLNGDQTQYIDHLPLPLGLSDPFPAVARPSRRWFAADALPDMPRVHTERVQVVLEDRPECRLGRLAR